MITDAIITIFGEYQPIIHTLADGSVVMGVDWSYVGAVALFGICLWSMFRLIGGVFKR